MIRQYLSQTNESATIAKSKKIASKQDLCQETAHTSIKGLWSHSRDLAMQRASISYANSIGKFHLYESSIYP